MFSSLTVDALVNAMSHCYLTFRADSVSWNPHKMLSVPVQCSVLLVKDEVCM